MTPKEVLAFAKEQGAKMVDFKFLDFSGLAAFYQSHR